MRWLVLMMIVLTALGWILVAVSKEFDAAGDLQGHRTNGAAAGLACVAVFFVLAFGVGLLLAKRR